MWPPARVAVAPVGAPVHSTEDTQSVDTGGVVGQRKSTRSGAHPVGSVALTVMC